MKDLKGSFKQVEWANSIRREFVERCAAQAASSSADSAAYLAAAEKNEALRSPEVVARRLAMHKKFAALVAAAESKTSAKFWIENRNNLEGAL